MATKRYCNMAKKEDSKKEIVFSTKNLTDMDINELIHVMIKINPKMEFCIRSQMPIAATGMNLSLIECISSIVIRDGDERYIHLLLKGSGIITLTETDFIEALNAKGLDKSINTFLKLYFQVEKPKSKEKDKGKKPKTTKTKKEENL